MTDTLGEVIMNVRLLSRIVFVALIWFVVIAAPSGIQDAQAYPKPALVSEAWHLDFECDAPRTLAVTDENGDTRWYWYLTYRVENNTGHDQLFIPEVTILTDHGQVVITDVDVPSKVFQKIKQQLRHPLLERPSKIIGKILQGPDHAKDGVAIWAVSQEDVDAFTLFFSGISGGEPEY